MTLQNDIAWYLDGERDCDFVQHLTDELLAEVERLRDRRCETCSSYNFWTATGSPDFCCCGNEVMDAVMVDGCNPGKDFGCNHWSAREEAGDE